MCMFTSKHKEYIITREYQTAILTVYNNCSESHVLGMQLNITTRPHS